MTITKYITGLYDQTETGAVPAVCCARVHSVILVRYVPSEHRLSESIDRLDRVSRVPQVERGTHSVMVYLSVTMEPVDVVAWLSGTLKLRQATRCVRDVAARRFTRCFRR